MDIIPLPLGLVGGDAMARTILAIRLRRVGLPVHSELQNRKRSKAYEAAKKECGTVFDLERAEDQERICWLLRAVEQTA
jgi:hypothetical protein